MSDLVTVATFQFPTEAQAARLRLEAEGLTPFFSDAEIVNMDWLLGNAVGDIKLQVPRSQVGAAAALLEQIRTKPERLARQDGEIETSVCLACGAAMAEDQSRCTACGWSYTDRADGE